MASSTCPSLHDTSFDTGAIPRIDDVHDERLSMAVVRTVAYSDLFDYPLTPSEIHRYLFGVNASSQVVSAFLQSDHLSPKILNRNQGFITLPGRDEIVENRHKREAVARELWQPAINYGRIIANLPFVRMVAITGELAVNNVNGKSDIDYFIVTEPDRLWLTRAMVILVVKIAAQRRITVCPNYLVTENALVLDQQNLYTAREMAQMVPLSGIDVYHQMRRANAWVSSFLPNASGPPAYIDESPRRSRARQLSETILRTSLGERVEQWEMKRKIEKLTRNHNADDEVAFSADWCKGHFDHHGHRTLQAFADRVRFVEERIQ